MNILFASYKRKELKVEIYGAVFLTQNSDGTRQSNRLVVQCHTPNISSF